MDCFVKSYHLQNVLKIHQLFLQYFCWGK